MTFGIEAVEAEAGGVIGSEVDSDRRLFGRRYRSGVDLAGEERIGGDRVEEDVMIVEWGRAVPETTRAVDMTAEPSLDPDFWLSEERSEDEEEDVVDTEGWAGYRDRLPGSKVGTWGAEEVLKSCRR